MRISLTYLLAATFAVGGVVSCSPAAKVAEKQPEAPTTTVAAAETKEDSGLAALAKITPEAAESVALKAVPGKVKEHGLEKEDGKLLYTFDIEVAGKAGIEEVHVDAVTGALLSHTHETPAAEAKEKAADAAKSPAPGAKTP